jgi:signal transduction histidine kinase
LRNALVNLLGNAWKYTARTEGPEVAVGMRVVAGESRFFVKDNGAGFDMAHAGQLFEPFHRLHRESEFTGTGLGLASVKRIVERHGGRVWAEAEPGKGTTIWFTMPGWSVS